MEYTGPISEKGLIIQGKLWPTPWKWKPTEIKKHIKTQPKLKKYFGASTEDKPST